MPFSWFRFSRGRTALHLCGCTDAAISVAAAFLIAGEPLLSAPPSHATASAHREAPARPFKSFGGVEYVRVSEISRQLALQTASGNGGRAVKLEGKIARLELSADTRETRINGLRVFLGSPVIFSSGGLYVSRIDFERCLVPLVQAGRGVGPPPLPRVIAVDAGHGGPDPGTVNPRVGLYEKDVAFDVAKRLKILLEQNGYRVVLTRPADRLLLPKAGPDELAERDHVAIEAKADIFVSIHFNELPLADKTTRGAEVYTYAPANQHATDWWDRREPGDAHLLTADQPGNRCDHWNVVLAQSIHRRLLQGLQTPDRGKKLMHLGVLRWLNCPAVLVEPAILTHDGEARRLATPEYRQQIAQSLADGIGDYAAVVRTLATKSAYR